MPHSFSKYIVSFLLLFCLCLSVIPITPALAATTWGIIQGDNNVATKIRSAPVNGDVIGKETYAILEIIGSVQGSDGYEWKMVNYKDQIGYVRADLISSYTETVDREFEEQLNQFPESYHSGLRLLHSLHPAWTFKADNLSISFDEAVAGETANWETKLVPSAYSNSYKSMAKNAYNWSSKAWYTTSGSWVSASRELIAYYLDPRNFLNENGVYQFVQQSYIPAVHNESGLQLICQGTFLANGFSDTGDYGGSYYAIIMEAANQSGVNPYIIAAMIITEQGVNGSSSLISGKDGYYNFFNYGASGTYDTDVYTNGIAYAKRQNWSSRSASIIGGAKLYAKNYISSGQDTYYYMDFDVLSSPYYNHQYAQSIFDANSKGQRIKNVCSTSVKTLTLRIPVYRDMPETPAPAVTASSALNNYYFTSLSVSGFSMYNQNYSITANGNLNLTYSLPDGAEYSGENSYKLSAGNNKIVLPVRSQSGFTNDYILNISASADCTLTVINSAVSPTVIKRGDTNGDGIINIIDLANLQKHLLGIITLAGDNLIAADTNSDGTVNIVDLANVQKHLLNIISLN